MAAAAKKEVASWKVDLVDNLTEKFEKYPVVGVLDISGIPAPQFQEMRGLLRGRARIKVSRKDLLKIAIQKASKRNPELGKLSKFLEGQSALIFTEMNPFKLWKFLDENKTSAPARPGMKAQKDIVVLAGETDFSPGPIVGELQHVGIKARIQAGKVVILENSKVVKEGETISEDVVSILSKFDIQPREIGFKLQGAFEEDVVYSANELVVDEAEVVDRLQTAFVNSLILSYEVKYPTTQTVKLMLSQANWRAQNLAINAFIFTSNLMPIFLGKAAEKANALARITAPENSEAVG